MTDGGGDERTTADPDTAVVPRRRLWRGLLVVVPLGGLAYALLFTAPGAGEVTDALAGMRPGAVAVAVAGEAVHLVGLALAYRAALAAAGATIPLRRQLAAFVAGNGVGQLLPAGGAVGGAVVGQRMIVSGAPRAAAAAAVALTGTISLLAVALLVAVGLALTTLAGSPTPIPPVLVALVVTLLCVVVGLVLAVVRSPDRGHRLLDLAAPVMRRVGADPSAWRASLDQLAGAPPTARGLLGTLAWALVAWTGNATVLWAVFVGLGTALPVDVLLVAFGFQHVVAMVPISPGGIGVVEAGMAGALTALGVPGATAVSGVVAYRLVAFWLPVVAGLTTHLRLVLHDDRRVAADRSDARGGHDGRP